MDKLTYPAPFRDWQGTHSIPWTKARRDEYKSIGGWFATSEAQAVPKPAPAPADNVLLALEQMTSEERYQLLQQLK